MEKTEDSPFWLALSALFGIWFRLLQEFVYWVLTQVKGSRRGALPPISNHLLLEPATVLAAKIRTGQVKSEAVVKAYIERIREVNVYINAVVDERFQAALQDARAVDDYVKNSGKTPAQLAFDKPLLGVPVSSKNSVAVKDMALTSGVIARKDVKADEDCAVITNLRLTGAIITCITNVPELCMWGDASNELHGTTNNPYDLTRISGGSTGGEGSLVSSAGSVIGIGNDIGGSIRIPSFCSGVFGHKPTIRVLSNKGQFPSSYDTGLDDLNVTGPLCRYAVDLIPMLKALGGPQAATKLKLDEKVDIKRLKVYYTENYNEHPLAARMDPELRESVRKVVTFLESTFGIKPKQVTIPHMDSTWPIWMSKIYSTETPAPLTDLSTTKPGEFNLWHELVKSSLGLSEHTFNFVYMTLVGHVYTSPFMKSTLAKNLKRLDEVAEYFRDLLKDDGIFIFPPSSTTAPYHQLQFLGLFNYAYTGLFSFLGYPVTQCPMGLSSESLPLGVQVVSGRLNDRYSLAVAREIEQHFGGWKSPSAIL